MALLKQNFKAMKKLCILLLVSIGMLTSSDRALAQSNLLRGRIYQYGKSSIKQPIPSAGLRLLGTSIVAVSDSMGFFSIKRESKISRISVSSIGFKRDTIAVDSVAYIEIALQENTQSLQQVLVQGKLNSIYINSLNPLNTQIMTKVELQKAACCNLSESFETNPSVDVNFSDAATGLKQIQMLGLTGQYIQIMEENRPSLRALSSVNGLSFIPGTWIESIQVTKGIGSVANGYESVVGQINIEEKKPKTSESLFINGYQSSMGRTEFNTNFKNKIGDKWASNTFLHYNQSWLSVDDNKDKFEDLPLGKQINLAQRWWYQEGNVTGQFGWKWYKDNRNIESLASSVMPSWLNSSMQNENREGWGKFGYVFPKEKYRSIGLIGYINEYHTDNLMTLHHYIGTQNTAYLNAIYQSILGSSVHQYRTGLSFLRDKINQTMGNTPYDRIENVLGSFVEYTYMPSTKWNIVAGYRGDYNSLFGWILTPRLHTKVLLFENVTLRSTLGKGTRTANPIAENMGLFFSSRTFSITNQNIQEKAWNYGLNLAWLFSLWNREGSLSLDMYRTDFMTQAVVNREQGNSITIGTLDGESFAQSAQVELNYELLKDIHLRTAYRYYDVKSTYDGVLKEAPMIAKHRFFINIDYQIKKWKFDATANWIGKKRIPATFNLEETQSPNYWVFNSQISYKTSQHIDLYLGIENLSGYTQKNRISLVGTEFEGANIWGPLLSQNIYLGMRGNF